MSNPQSSPSNLTVGVLLLSDEGVQFLDVAPVDVLAMMTPEYLAAVGAPEPLLQKAVKMEICYISESGEGLFPLTGGAKIAVTVSVMSFSNQTRFQSPSV